MKKVYVSWTDVQRQTQEILRQMHLDRWMPDYIVGVTRGGLIPANLISQYLDVPMQTLKVSLRSDQDCESNLWMPEDAIGYVHEEHRKDNGGWRHLTSKRKNILIVDDINDSGATLNWIKDDWQKSCFPTDEEWKDVWNNNVRVAVLYDNETSESELDVNYCAETINKVADPQWIVFPWEEWWQKWHPNEEHI